eukprot:m.173849 g.173849  ORF g.173849 m.173849 type:complete len:397 (+) comp15313_c3_seq12:2465-3655(+)
MLKDKLVELSGLGALARERDGSVHSRLCAESLSNMAASATLRQAMRRLSVVPRTEYGKRRTVTLIPGDGIGPELCASVRSVFSAIQAPVDFEEIDFHGASATADKCLEQALFSMRRNGVGLKGIIETPRGLGSKRSYNMSLRLKLDLFANVIVCKSLPGVEARHKEVDFVIIRQNTEGEYSGLEHEITPGVVESLKVISRAESLRIAKYAFDYATQKGRHKVTAIHKANIMKQGDGLFLECCREVSALYPKITFDSMIVDNASMQLVSKPGQFDVVVTPNLYGTILGNIGAGLVGGAGLVPGFNIGHEFTLFEPGARHTAMEIAGTNKANSIGMLLSSSLMLRHLGFNTHALTLKQAVQQVLTRGKVRTPDIGGTNTTTELTDAVIAEAQRVMLDD